MERLTERLELAEKVVCSFGEALKMPMNNSIIRDAAIQRFEFSLETVWKLLQLYLNQKEGFDFNSPKSVMRDLTVVICQNIMLMNDLVKKIKIKLS